MAGVAYVNGRYALLSEAAVSIEDRGFQFADAIYEAWAVMGGKLADADGHFERMERSLGELQIAQPMSRAALKLVIAETLRRNRISDGFCYLQISRGEARRDHKFPSPQTRPTLVITAKPLDYAAEAKKAEKGVAVFTQPDIRWGRCDIKTINLLPNVLAKQAAKERGAAEVVMVDDMGLVTEGGASNVWIVDQDGKLRTRDVQANILRGITRDGLLAIIADEGLELDERPFTLDDVKAAREAFISSATTFATPVISLDGTRIGDGKPGPIATKLRGLYLDQAKRDAI